MAKTTVSTLRRMKQDGERIAVLTAYDASFARLLDEAGVEVLLVGDSLGNVVQGHDTTIPVTLDDMVYHTAAVRRGSRNALIVADMPFLTDASPDRALDSAARLMQEGGAQMVKVEGGAVMVKTIERLTGLGVPVCGHLGLLPQSVHKVGGYRIQGRESHVAAAMLEDAEAIESAGADMLVLECVPRGLAAEIRANLTIPVIGIGAGPECDGQVLVLYDILDLTPGKRPAFSKDFLAGTGTVPAAVAEYVRAVKAGDFPGPDHTFD